MTSKNLQCEMDFMHKQIPIHNEKLNLLLIKFLCSICKYREPLLGA